MKLQLQLYLHIFYQKTRFTISLFIQHQKIINKLTVFSIIDVADSQKFLQGSTHVNQKTKNKYLSLAILEIVKN